MNIYNYCDPKHSFHAIVAFLSPMSDHDDAFFVRSRNDVLNAPRRVLALARDDLLDQAYLWAVKGKNIYENVYLY